MCPKQKKPQKTTVSSEYLNINRFYALSTDNLRMD